MKSDNFNDNAGLLFFVQRMYEMLFHYTIDIFRVPLLNTRLLSREFLKTCEEVRAGILKFESTNPILDELKSSLHQDPVVKELIPTQEKVFIEKKLSDRDSKNVFGGVQYLYNRMNNRAYYAATKDLLIKTASMPKEKKKIEAIARIFVTELISYGYTQNDIFHELQKTMLSKGSEVGIDDMKAFLDRFDFKKHSYNVYFVAKAIDGASPIEQVPFLRKLFTVEDDGNFTKAAQKCGAVGSDSVLLIPDINSLDAYGAAKDAEGRLEFAMRFHSFLINERIVRLSEKCVVVDIKTGDCAYPNCGEEAHHLIKPLPKDRSKLAEDSIETLILIFRETKNIDEFDRIVKAIDLHNSSITINSYQNSFLCLWTALEVLCEKEDNSQSVVYSICTAIASALELRYLTNILNDIENNLKKKGVSYQELLSSEREGGKPADRFAELVFSSDKECDFNSLLSLLEGNPLLINRLWELREQGKKPKNLVKRIESYGERVGWHVKRMYRTRNRIVHAGDTPQYLESLGEHLHMYLDEFIQELLSQLTDKGCTSIKDALRGMSYEHEMFMDRLRDNSLFEGSNYKFYSW